MPTTYGILYKNGINYSHDTAESISYDNTNSGLTSTNMQDVIDEISPKLVPTGGTTATYLKDNGTWGIPTDTTYGVVSTAANGLVPANGSNAKYLRGDGTWQTTAAFNTTYDTMSVGTTGLVPTGGTSAKFLRGDGWQTSAAFNTTYGVVSTAANGLVPANGSNAKYLRGDGTWQTTAAFNTTYGTVTTAAAGRIPSGGTSANYLRGNGTFGTPPNTDNMAKQNFTTANNFYCVLLSESAYTTATKTEGTRKNYLNFRPGNGCLQFQDRTNSSNFHLRPGYMYFRYTSSNPICSFVHNDSQNLVIKASNENFGVELGVLDNVWGFCPYVDNGVVLGSSSYKWTAVYCSQASILTSDKNQKKDIIELNSSIKDFIMDLKPVSYKFKNTNDLDKHDRTHYGLIAQDVEETMNKMGMTALDFAGFCKDQKMEEYEVVNLKDDGTPFKNSDGSNQMITKQKPIKGEYVYGLRYEEFIAPMIKVIQIQKNDVDKQQIELEELKSRLDKLENK